MPLIFSHTKKDSFSPLGVMYVCAWINIQIVGGTHAQTRTSDALLYCGGALHPRTGRPPSQEALI